MRFKPLLLTLACAFTAAVTPAHAVDSQTLADIRSRVSAIEAKAIAWRRDIHQHPELSSQEHRTAALVADHLRKLGLEVRTGVGGTGVVGVLRGSKPGKVLALRADMDALPVKEIVDLPFASKARGRHMGKEVDVMHACGHDGHTAILMATAEVLAGMRDRIPGTVKFIFQPAEEGASEAPKHEGEHIGARAMVDAGALENPKVDAVFGLHLMPLPAGRHPRLRRYL
jgi:amidohydrolase